MGSQDDAEVVELWRHADPTSTQLWAFKETINQKYNNLDLSTYHDLYEWSIDNIPEFWEEIWRFCGIRASKAFDKVINFFKILFRGRMTRDLFPKWDLPLC